MDQLELEAHQLVEEEAKEQEVLPKVEDVRGLVRDQMVYTLPALVAQLEAVVVVVAEAEVLPEEPPVFR